MAIMIRYCLVLRFRFGNRNGQWLGKSRHSSSMITADHANGGLLKVSSIDPGHDSQILLQTFLKPCLTFKNSMLENIDIKMSKTNFKLEVKTMIMDLQFSPTTKGAVRLPTVVTCWSSPGGTKAATFCRNGRSIIYRQRGTHIHPGENVGRAVIYTCSTRSTALLSLNAWVAATVKFCFTSSCRIIKLSPKHLILPLP